MKWLTWFVRIFKKPCTPKTIVLDDAQLLALAEKRAERRSAEIEYSRAHVRLIQLESECDNFRTSPDKERET